MKARLTMKTVNFEKYEVSSPIGSPFITNLYYIKEDDKSDWSFNLHSHAEALEISYIFKGSTKQYIDGKLYNVQAGDIIVKNPTIPHAEKSSINNPIEEIGFNVKGIKLENMKENYMLVENAGPVISAGKYQHILEGIFRQIISCSVSEQDLNTKEINSLLTSALHLISYRIKVSNYPPSNKHEDTIRTIRKYIDDHFKEDISLESLSDTFHISVYHLSRQFKKYTGYTVNHYISSCRLGEAQIRLIFGKETISDIAKDCGYPNLSYFYTKFKKKIGCTPTEYRQQYNM